PRRGQDRDVQSQLATILRRDRSQRHPRDRDTAARRTLLHRSGHLGLVGSSVHVIAATTTTSAAIDGLTFPDELRNELRNRGVAEVSLDPREIGNHDIAPDCWIAVTL